MKNLSKKQFLEQLGSYKRQSTQQKEEHKDDKPQHEYWRGREEALDDVFALIDSLTR